MPQPPATSAARHAAERRKPRPLPPEYESLIACLEEAGTTLLSLPPSGFSPRLRTSSLPILREAAEAYGWRPAEIRPPMPSAARISRMDRALGYLSLIPQDRYLLRRVVGCRALVHPISGRHLYSWRRLGEAIGADHKAVQRWHAEGIRMIIFALRRQAADESAYRLFSHTVITDMPQLPRSSRLTEL